MPPFAKGSSTSGCREVGGPAALRQPPSNAAGGPRSRCTSARTGPFVRATAEAKAQVIERFACIPPRPLSMPGAASLSHDDRDLADGVTAFDLAVAVAQPLERKAMADVRSQEPSVDETRDPREKLARSLRLDVV